MLSRIAHVLMFLNGNFTLAAVAGVFFLPIVNDRWDDPIGISVMKWGR